MKRILAVLAILMVMMVAGNAWAQEELDLRSLGVKEFSVDFNTTRLSTETTFTGDEFDAFLSRAIVDRYGQVLALDGAKVHGKVIWSYNWDRVVNSRPVRDQEAYLEVEITHIETRDGKVTRIYTESVVRVTKRPTKKSVVWNTFARAFQFGFLGALAGRYGAVAAAGFGAGVQWLNDARERNDYKPVPVVVDDSDVWFKVKKIEK